MQRVFHIRVRPAPDPAAPVVAALSPYPLGDNRLGVCSRSSKRLARGVLYLIAGGGDLQAARNAAVVVQQELHRRAELPGSKI